MSKGIKTSLVKVHATPRGGYDAWTVDYKFDGKRQRKMFSDKEAADAHAKRVADQIGNGTHNAQIGRTEAASYIRCIQILDGVPKPIELVCSEYADAYRTLNGVPLAEAIREYAQRHSSTPRLVSDLVADFLSSKDTVDLSADYKRQLRSILERFAEAFPCNVDSLNGKELEAWLKKMPSSETTKANYLRTISALIAFAKKTKVLSREWDELDAVNRPKSRPGKVQIVTPDELQTLLAFAEKDYAEKGGSRWLPYLAIRAFTGLRTWEVSRLRREHFYTDIISADADITKTGTKRNLPILPVLKEWLKAYPLGEKIQHFEDNVSQAHDFRRFRELAGLKGHRQNFFRDCYVSYRMALLGEAGKVAEETGHSITILRRSYHAIRMPDGTPIDAQAGARWFAVYPQSCHQNVSKIISMRKAQ